MVLSHKLKPRKSETVPLYRLSNQYFAIKILDATVLTFFKFQANKDPRQTQQSLDQQRKRLMKVTKTISISVVATLVFCVVPDVVAHLDLFDNLTPFYIMFNFNPMANFFIYAWHFNDIRSGETFENYSYVVLT